MKKNLIVINKAEKEPLLPPGRQREQREQRQHQQVTNRRGTSYNVRYTAIGAGTGVAGASGASGADDDDDDIAPYLPGTWTTIFYALLITVGLVLAIYVFIIAVREHNLSEDITQLINQLTATSMILTTSINNLNNIVVDIRGQLILVEADIGILEGNITSLAARIANISCIGIKTVNDAVTTAALLVESGIAEFFEVTTVNQTNGTQIGGLILVNGTRLLQLLEAQQVSLDTLQALINSINAALALLESLTARHIDMQPPLLNNIEFVGLCNASAYGVPSNNSVVIDACGIQASVEQQFQAVYAQFLVALEKIAILQANITYMNTTITLIENIIAEVQSKGLFTVNYRLPNATTGAIELLAEDIYLNITSTHITNEGLRSIDGIAKNNITLAAGSGIGITNDAPGGTITVSNLNAAPTCQIQAIVMNFNASGSYGVSGGLFRSQLDVNFQPGDITTTPPGCYANASMTFRRIGTAFPFVQIFNTVCKPPGRWIFRFEIFSAVWAFTNTFAFVNMDIGLGGDLAPFIPIPIAFWNVIMWAPAVWVPSNFQSTYTFSDPAPVCYNVTIEMNNADALFIQDVILSKWTFTQID